MALGQSTRQLLSPVKATWQHINGERNNQVALTLQRDENELVKLFYSGPLINVEMLVTMLEKHDIAATQEYLDSSQPDDGDLNRMANVLVRESDYERAHKLFYSGREDEL